MTPHPPVLLSALLTQAPALHCTVLYSQRERDSMHSRAMQHRRPLEPGGSVDTQESTASHRAQHSFTRSIAQHSRAQLLTQHSRAQIHTQHSTAPHTAQLHTQLHTQHGTLSLLREFLCSNHHYCSSCAYFVSLLVWGRNQ